MGIQDEDTDPALVTVGTMKLIFSHLNALVDYVESVEWAGPMVTVCRMDGSERRAARCTSCTSVMPDGSHQDDCKWMALMRAAGRR